MKKFLTPLVALVSLTITSFASDLSDALKTNNANFSQKSDEQLAQLGEELAVEYFNFEPEERIILDPVEADSLGTKFGLEHGLRGWQCRVFSAHFMLSTMALEGINP
jgi:hypothetical protein